MKILPEYKVTLLTNLTESEITERLNTMVQVSTFPKNPAQLYSGRVTNHSFKLQKTQLIRTKFIFPIICGKIYSENKKTAIDLVFRLDKFYIILFWTLIFIGFINLVNIAVKNIFGEGNDQPGWNVFFILSGGFVLLITLNLLILKTAGFPARCKEITEQFCNTFKAVIKTE